MKPPARERDGRTMTEEEFRAELEGILELETGAIMGSEILDDLPGWDSMSLLAVIALADQRLGTVLSAAAVMECRTGEELTGLFLGSS